MIEFYVPGRPQAQGSKVKTRWGAMKEANDELGPWRERVALAAYAALQDSEYDDDDEPGINGPVAIGCEFVLYRPKSTPKSADPPATKAPDIDKCCRAILDALTHVVYEDDAQVTFQLATKRVAKFGEGPGVRVWVGAATS